jgi:phosphatidylethanolamine/phosphatidyl-N-methylethanolamine N-methyltransferase
MPLRGTKIGRVLRQRRDDAAIAWTFFRQWLKAPLTTAAVSPSSKELAAEMLSQLPEPSGKVIELGGGTGVFTEALLERGIEPQNLLVFELNESLHLHLTQRFPNARIVCADALSTARVVEREKFAKPGEVDAVISGLGLLSMSRELQYGILEAAFSVLAPNGRFIQFTYGPTCPVKREVMRELHLTAKRTGFTMWNVPPASVYVITRSRSRNIRPTRAK